MSGPKDPDCAPLFAHFGLPFGGQPAVPQTFFRKLAPPPPAEGSGSK
jgi:hypothetical protein